MFVKENPDRKKKKKKKLSTADKRDENFSPYCLEYHENQSNDCDIQ